MNYEQQIAAAELLRRQTEAIRLFRPLEHQLRIFTSRASELLIVGGSRAGKTTCTSALLASAVTGMPVIGPDGQPLPSYWPNNRPLTFWLIGKEENHCATWHRMLLEPQNELKCLRDQDTGDWRCFDPDRDQGREDVQIMGPMIPHRFIEGGYEKGISWNKKRGRIFHNIRLRPLPTFAPGLPGSVIHFFPSSGEVKKGDPVDGIFIDEHIRIFSHYVEWLSRLSDRKGRIIWPITPATQRNPALNDLIVRCEKDAGLEKPDCEKITLHFSKNPFIDDDEKRKRMKSMNARDWANRDRGELLDGDTAVYPEFKEPHHSTPAYHEAQDDAIDRKLRETGGAIPDDWCREIVLDPGSAHPGALFCALPPPELGDAGVAYDEVYLPNSDPNSLAKVIADKAGQQLFERFIIDFRAAVQRTIGTVVGKNTYILYAEAFAKHGLVCEQTGSNFQPSESDWLPGIQAVRHRMANMNNGRPWLRVLQGRCYNLCRMLETYERKIDRLGFVEDKPAPKQVDCLPDCLRYWVTSEPVYRPPPEKKTVGSAAWRAYRALEDEKERRARQRGFFMGAGAAPRNHY